MKRARTIRLIAALAVVVTAGSGCQSDVGPDRVLPSAASGSLANFEELAASEGIADQAQLDILRSAVAENSLSFESYSQAVNAAVACIRDAGVLVDGPITDHSSGYPVLRYGFAAGVNEDGEPDNPVPDQCIMAHSFYVEAAYTSQPSSQAALDAALEAKRAEVNTCAKAAGIAADDSLPIREWLAEIWDSGESGRDCIVTAEITEF